MSTSALEKRKENIEKGYSLKPLNVGYSYLHDFGIISVKGWGDPFLVVTERTYIDGESYGYNYWKLGVTFKTKEEGFAKANELDEKYGFPAILNSKSSEEILLKIQVEFPNSNIKK
jgi:hypothetical protein